jgi:hypothetical protein
MSISARIAAEASMDDGLRGAMNDWQLRVLALSSVDPVCTEVVRVRAARHHDCHT